MRLWSCCIGMIRGNVRNFFAPAAAIKFIDLKSIAIAREKFSGRSSSCRAVVVEAVLVFMYTTCVLGAYGKASQRGGPGKSSFNDRIACSGAVSQIWQVPRRYTPI